MGREKLARLSETNEVLEALSSAIEFIKGGGSVEEVMKQSNMKALARTVADLTKDATTRPIEAPTGPHNQYTGRSSMPLPPRGGRGSGPEPLGPTLLNSMDTGKTHHLRKLMENKNP